MADNLFKKSSLERASSPDRLNEYIKVTSPRILTVLIGILAVFISVGVWSVTATIPDTISENGIIFPQEGVTDVKVSVAGTISEMRVSVGDQVKAGQILAIIPNNNIIKQISTLKSSTNFDQNQLLQLEKQYEAAAVIKAPVSGTVLFAKNAYDTLAATDTLASIVKQDDFSNEQQLICYVSTGDAKKLTVGMEIQASPDFAPRENYGYMTGHITYIGTYPVSSDDVTSKFGYSKYSEGLLPTDGSNAVEVHVNLDTDANSANKLKWSNSQGESLKISIGTKCNLLIVVKDYKPYELVLSN